MTELEGQMALFDLDEVQPVETCECPQCSSEVCDECGARCTSSKECVELAGYQEDDVWHAVQ